MNLHIDTTSKVRYSLSEYFADNIAITRSANPSSWVERLCRFPVPRERRPACGQERCSSAMPKEEAPRP